MKAQRGDRQIITAQTQCRDADDECRDRRDDDADAHAQRKPQQIAHGAHHDGGAVRTDAHKPGMSQRELPADTDDQIQRNGQDDVDADVIQRDLIIAADDADVHQKSDQRKDDRREYDPADIFL